MVFDPTTHQMLEASKGGGRGIKKRGGFRRRKSSEGGKLGAAQRDRAAAASAVPAPEGGPAVPPVVAPAAAPHVYSDERMKRAARNARMRGLSYPVAIGAGGAALFGGMALGLEAWLAALVASVIAAVAYKIIDSQIR